MNSKTKSQPATNIEKYATIGFRIKNATITVLYQAGAFPKKFRTPALA